MWQLRTVHLSGGISSDHAHKMTCPQKSTQIRPPPKIRVGYPPLSTDVTLQHVAEVIKAVSKSLRVNGKIPSKFISQIHAVATEENRLVLTCMTISRQVIDLRQVIDFVHGRKRRAAARSTLCAWVWYYSLLSHFLSQFEKVALRVER